MLDPCKGSESWVEKWRTWQGPHSSGYRMVVEWFAENFTPQDVPDQSSGRVVVWVSFTSNVTRFADVSMCKRCIRIWKHDYWHQTIGWFLPSRQRPVSKFADLAGLSADHPQDLESLKRDVKAERDCSNKAPSRDEMPSLCCNLYLFIQKWHYHDGKMLPHDLYRCCSNRCMEKHSLECFWCWLSVEGTCTSKWNSRMGHALIFWGSMIIRWWENDDKNDEHNAPPLSSGFGPWWCQDLKHDPVLCELEERLVVLRRFGVWRKPGERTVEHSWIQLNI